MPSILSPTKATVMLLFALPLTPYAGPQVRPQAAAAPRPGAARKRLRARAATGAVRPDGNPIDAAIRAGTLGLIPSLIATALPHLHYQVVQRAVAALVRAAHWRAVVRVFDTIQEARLPACTSPRLYTDFFLSLMKIGGTQQAHRAFHEWRQLADAGELSDFIGPRSYNFLFVMLARVGMIDEATLIRNACLQQGYYLNRYSYNAFLSACAKAYRFDDAFGTLRQMAELGVSPDVISFNVLISCCVKSGDVDVALSILARMRDWGISPDIYSYNSVVNGLRKSRMLDEAFELVAQMERDSADGPIVGSDPGVSPDLVTYNTLLSGIAGESRPDLERAMRVKHHMESRGLECNEVTYNALMAAAAKADLLEEAFSIYDEMIARSLKPNCECFTTLITLCGRAQLIDRAFKIHNHMIVSGIKPNVITFNALLTACRRNDSNAGDAALEVLRVMRETPNCEPDVITFSTVIDSLGRAGRFDEMRDVLQDMRQGGIAPNLVTYTTMISALTRAGMLEEAREVLADMEDHEVQPNVYTFSSLINGAAKRGEFETALEILDMMRGRGIEASNITYAMLVQLAVRLGRREMLDRVVDEIEGDGRIGDECLRKVGELSQHRDILNGTRNRALVKQLCNLLGECLPVTKAEQVPSQQ